MNPGDNRNRNWGFFLFIVLAIAAGLIVARVSDDRRDTSDPTGNIAATGHHRA